MKQSLQLKLAQQLSLTPQLKQSLKLLQLPSLELEQEVQAAIDSNPLLEKVENDSISEANPAAPSGELALDNNLPQPIAEASDPSVEIENLDHLAPEQDLAMNWQESLESRRTVDTRSIGSESSEFTQFAVRQETLFEHLSWQVQMTSLSARDKLIADSILRSLDEQGYLRVSLADICAAFDPQMMVEQDEVGAVLSLIKTLEPVGVGARDLSERLLILLDQSTDPSIGFKLAKLIVSDHLDLLATRNIAKLKSILNANEDELNSSLELITGLNPRIASRFASDAQDHVIPDVIVKKIGTTWLAEINPDNQSKLRINQTYSDLLKSNIDAQGGEYIQQHLNQAKIFIKSLMSRYDTLQLVAQTIVERQSAFFEAGDQHMQPMVLQDVAEALDMHESTISRAVAGKYLLSPRGVYELKYFFSSALSNTQGAASSSTAIRSLIKKLVEEEPKTKPLSDSKIAIELKQQGHIVARRTVAKYRESMHIAPSSQRKALI